MTPKYRLGKFQTKHDTCWCGVTNVRRKHLRALLGRVVHTLGYVISAFGVRRHFPMWRMGECQIMTKRDGDGCPPKNDKL